MQTSMLISLAISRSIITGGEYCPDMLLLTSQNTLYVAELTVGHESNLENNSNLVKELKDIYKSVIFVNISMSCLGVFANQGWIQQCFFRGVPGESSGAGARPLGVGSGEFPPENFEN